MKRGIMLLWTMVAMLALSGTVSGRIWYVHPDSALNSIQAGLDSCSAGDTVFVAGGTYYEILRWPSTEGIDLISESGADSTVIDGGRNGYVVGIRGDSTTLLKGFTIQNGYSFQGGGIYMYEASPIITDCIVTGNVASWHFDVGVIHCRYSSPKISNCAIVENSGEDGSMGHTYAIMCDDESSAMITNCTISDNTYCGGILCDVRSNPLIRNNSITNNGDIVLSGGGIACRYNCNPVIVNNTISRNLADGGGGIWCEGNPIITNCILWANIPNDIQGNVNVTYSDVEGGWEGEGNIDTDPLFRDPENGDFHLMAIECGDSYDSPCIDVGSPNILDKLLDCAWGLGTFASDMGAYGGGESLICGDCNGDGWITAADRTYLLNYIYFGGSPPIGAADVNLDGRITAADATYIVNYIYKGGPPPCQPPVDYSPYSDEPGTVGFSLPRTENGIIEIPVLAEFGVPLTFVHLDVIYESGVLEPLMPKLTSRTEKMELFCDPGLEKGRMKLGISFTPDGELIQPGDGAVVMLRFRSLGKQVDCSSLKIEEVILVDEQSRELKTTVLGYPLGAALPKVFSLRQNYPNPFSSGTEISYAIPKSSRVELTIYNINGQIVRILAKTDQEPGYYRVHWDAKNDNGIDVANGVYFYRLQAGDYMASKKMLLLR